jgi:hypothetical protein
MKNKEKSAKSPAKIVKVKDLTAKKDVNGGGPKGKNNPAENDN